MRNKYRNGPEIKKTGGNAIRLATCFEKLADNSEGRGSQQLETGMWNRNKNYGLQSQLQASEISRFGSKIFAPAPVRLGPLKTKNNCILY